MNLNFFTLPLRHAQTDGHTTWIQKYSKGSFKFMRFISSPDFPKKLDGFLKFNTDCLRFLITKSFNELDETTPQVNKDN